MAETRTLEGAAGARHTCRIVAPMFRVESMPLIKSLRDRKMRDIVKGDDL